jgi:hypothetical protein
MKNVIIRNIERLINDSKNAFVEKQVEPMTQYKWHKLYKISQQYGITAWVAEGIKLHQDDFFMQIPEDLMQNFLNTTEEKSIEKLERFNLDAERAESLKNRLSSKSLHAYARDFIQKVTNIEE